MLAAVREGDAKELAELIRQNPGFDVNMAQDRYGDTLLGYACTPSQRSPMIPFLLAHPDIDVNSRTLNENTPFRFACFGGSTSGVREML